MPLKKQISRESARSCVGLTTATPTPPSCAALKKGPALLTRDRKAPAGGTCISRSAAYDRGDRPLPFVRSVVLDIKMPGMDGLITLKKIKALHPELPVVMATAVEDEASMEHALVLGAHDYIFKPYNLSVLELMLTSLKRRSGRLLASQTA